MATEVPLVFEIEGESAVGVLHEAAHPGTLGVVIVTGGPQYRAGSHRQFVRLSRDIAAAGCDVLRFDYRGMGDSEGERRSFESISVDLRCAIDELIRRRSRIQRIALLGLCDGATAALMYAPSDTRVQGLLLFNPWARSEAGYSRMTMLQYYLGRVMSGDFWKKMFRGQVSVRASAIETVSSMRGVEARQSAGDYLDTMDVSARSFHGEMIVILSEKDLTANEFSNWITSNRRRRRRFRAPNVQRTVIRGANHTLSSPLWMRTATDLVVVACRAWARERG